MTFPKKKRSSTNKSKTLAQKAHQTFTKKNFEQQFNKVKKKFQEGKEYHEKMIKVIKVMLILGMIIMGGIYHYTGFMKEHGKLFAFEVLIYAGCALLAYFFINFMRQQLHTYNTSDFWMGAFKMVAFTLVVVVFAELSGLNTKFVKAEEEGGNSTPYRKEALRQKKLIAGHMIITVDLLFLLILIAWHWWYNDRISFNIIMALVAIALVSKVATSISKAHHYLVSNQWLPEGSVSNSELGLSVALSVSFIVFTLLVLVTSLFRYDSFQIYSYVVNNPNFCGWKRVAITIILFVVEALITAALFAGPIVYVGYNRNHPELGKEYKLKEDKEVFVDFGLLTLKIFIFIVALQMTGFYDSMNEGYCRSKGCNISATKKGAKCDMIF